MLTSPAFGQADLTNCERELIHFAGSVQPHGMLLALRGPALQVVQASANAERLLGVAAGSLLGQPLSRLGKDAELCVQNLAGQGRLAEPEALRCQMDVRGKPVEFEGTLHRIPGGELLLEVEPVGSV
ncbi:MAG: PAS sensor protein, partial [Gammaproteobacteria bacterium]|nr:PAS sensor protein [Gammaproteobacteria bacterium]MBU1442843.1 PAS sensor protein [Gammaproteobacteria bacterium]